MKKPGLKLKLITSIAIPIVGLAALLPTLTGCSNQRPLPNPEPTTYPSENSNDFYCPEVPGEELIDTLEGIQRRYGLNVTVHDFLNRGMQDNCINNKTRDEIMPMFNSSDRLTLEHLYMIGCTRYAIEQELAGGCEN